MTNVTRSMEYLSIRHIKLFYVGVHCTSMIIYLKHKSESNPSCTSYLLLHNKLFKNLVTENTNYYFSGYPSQFLCVKNSGVAWMSSSDSRSLLKLHRMSTSVLSPESLTGVGKFYSKHLLTWLGSGDGSWYKASVPLHRAAYLPSHPPRARDPRHQNISCNMPF